MIRSWLKRPIERALGWGPVTRFTTPRVRGKTLILAYHAIVPRSAGGAGAVGERALYVAQTRFAEQLDMLASVADVVALAQLDDRESSKPRVAVTFDDAYRGAVTVAIDELVARALPATVFVAPGRIDGHVFWWDALGGASGGLDAQTREHALMALAGDDERVRAWAAASHVATRDDLPDYARAASLAEIERAAQRPGITIGSHSWSHANLTRLSPVQLAGEMTRSFEWVRERFGARAVPWLAYPYGLESPDVRHAAADAGYAFAVRITGGWHRAADVAPHARPRLNVSAGLSVDGLRARVLGAWPT